MNNNFVQDPINPELFFLSQTLCTSHKRDFLNKGELILGLFFAVVVSLGLSREEFDKKEQEGKIKINSKLIIVLDEDTETVGKITIDYGTLKRLIQSAPANLNNQVFLMLYGNAETYITNMVIDAYRNINTQMDPYEATLRLLSTTKWKSKIHKIMNKFDVKLGDKVFEEKFRNFKMSLLKREYDNPLEFLEDIAEVRHRLVHYNGRADKKYLQKFPNSRLSEGDIIQLPFGATLSMQSFFIQLVEIIDEAFALKFGWHRKMIVADKL